VFRAAWGAFSDMQGDYTVYRIFKSALNAVTRILVAELMGSVAVNSVCPGWIKTDMGGTHADREDSQGAAGVVWLALDAPQELTRKFLRDGNVISR
jgi:NAD(P)-dependent dehydrogenase (short-subunit alcohol dehydrogenase family)